MYKFVVETVEKNTPSTLLVTLKSDEPDHVFGFLPGQYVAMSFLRHGRSTPARCFSVVSSPTDPEHIQLSTRIKGRFTTALSKIQPGADVSIRGPYGSFVFDADKHHKLVMLAGGIGITPFISIIRYATRLHLPNKMVLLFSCQTDSDVPFAQELIKLQAQNPNFTVVFILGDDSGARLPGQQIEHGRIDTKLLQQVTNNKFEDKDYFICGPPGFMKAMASTLLENGVEHSQIVTEAFSQGPTRQTGKLWSWPANVYALSAIGMVLGSLVVMVSDIVKTLPPINSFSSGKSQSVSTLTNARQSELDKLVNSISPTVSTNTSAPKAKAVAPKATASRPAQTRITTTPVATPAPVRTPVCTTTSSGTVCQ